VADHCPILLEKDREPAAVIISLEEFRKALRRHGGRPSAQGDVDWIKSAGLKAPKGASTLDLIRELRGS